MSWRPAPIVSPVCLAVAMALPAAAGEATTAAPLAPDFGPWLAAVDAFLAQPQRYSEFSRESRAQLASFQPPVNAACFERLLETLPAASRWQELPALTQARLPAGLPSTSAALAPWWDAELLHLFALTLQLPAHGADLASHLDRVRTVRWLLQDGSLAGMDAAERWQQRLTSLETKLRAYLAEHDGSSAPPPTEAFAQAVREATEPVRLAAARAIGEPALQALEQVALDRSQWHSAEQAHAILEAACLQDLARLSQLSEAAPEVRQAAVAQAEQHQAQALAAEHLLQAAQSRYRAAAEAQPELQAWFQFGPWPVPLRRHLQPEEAPLEASPRLEVPDLVASLGPEPALELLRKAVAAPLELAWEEAASTRLAVVGWLTTGQLNLSPEPAQAVLDSLLDSWNGPAADQGAAILALASWLEAHPGAEPMSEEDLVRCRSLAHLATGHPDLASPLRSPETGYQGLDGPPLNRLPGSCGPAVLAFLLRSLDQQPSRDARDWAELVRRGVEQQQAGAVLALVEKHLAANQAPEFAQVLHSARVAAGGSGAGQALLAQLRRPWTGPGTLTSGERSSALQHLYQLGQSLDRPEWCRQALTQLQALLRHWSTGPGRDASDGGQPWASLPGWLAGLGRLDLADTAAQLNLRWALNHEEGMGVFLLNSDQEQERHQGPLSALAGQAQVCLLRGRPQAVLDLLQRDPRWSVDDLQEVLDQADPSFPPDRRLTLRESAAQALERLGRRTLARRIRQAHAEDGWRAQLSLWLDGPDRPALLPGEELGLRSLLGSVPVPAGMAEPSLAQLASGLDRLNLAPARWQAPPSLLPFTAAAHRHRRDRDAQAWLQPIPATRSFRAYILASLLSLRPLREALLRL